MATGIVNRLVDTAQVRLWALSKVPLLAWVRPRVETLNDSEAVISIPLNRRQKNHLNSMYFGVLACGADLAGGLLAFRQTSQKKAAVSLVFKDFRAEFLRRPEARTYFTCRDGAKIKDLVARAINTGERVHETVQVTATCPDASGEEPVAQFALTLSLKRKG